MFKRILISSLQWALAAGTLFWLIHTDKLDPATLRIRAGGLPWVTLACLFLVLNALTIIARWRLLLKALGLNLSWSHAIQIHLQSALFINLPLGAVGGVDVAQATISQRYMPGTAIVATVSILGNRILGLIALIPLAACGVVLNWTSISQAISPNWPQTTLYASLAVGGICLSMTYAIIWGRKKPLVLRILSRHPIRHLNQTMLESLRALKQNRVLLSWAFAISFLTHIACICSIYALAHAIRTEPPNFEAFLFVVPTGVIIMAIPITPGGIGLGQWAFAALFALLGQQDLAFGANLVSLYQIVVVGFSLVGIACLLKPATRPQVPRRCPPPISST